MNARLRLRLLFLRLRPWLPLLSVAVALAAVFVSRHFRPAPPPAPVEMAPPPYDPADLLREQMQSLHVEGEVVPAPGRTDAFCVVAPGGDVSAVRGPLDAADFPGCWEGVLLAQMRGSTGDGANEGQAGSFHFTGDAAMVRRIREELEHPAGP